MPFPAHERGQTHSAQLSKEDEAWIEERAERLGRDVGAIYESQGPITQALREALARGARGEREACELVILRFRDRMTNGTVDYIAFQEAATAIRSRP